MKRNLKANSFQTLIVSEALRAMVTTKAWEIHLPFGFLQLCARESPSQCPVKRQPVCRSSVFPWLPHLCSLSLPELASSKDAFTAIPHQKFELPQCPNTSFLTTTSKYLLAQCSPRVHGIAHHLLNLSLLLLDFLCFIPNPLDLCRHFHTVTWCTSLCVFLVVPQD